MGSFSYTAFSTGIKPLLFFLLILLTQSACPNNPDPLECGENQIEINGSCECAEGYHWNEDQTQCKMDTTSHDFIWEIDTLGDYGSYLNDVAIIDENNVWGVGYIKTADSTYNAAHWDGSRWNLERLPAVAYGGYISQGALTSIHLINSENIWCSSDAGSYVHWNGESWQSEWIPDRGGGINAIWGTSSSNLYFVGTNGSIVHYDGTEFARMESGTEVDLKDIQGTPDGEHVFITGYTVSGSLSGHSIVLDLTDGIWNTLYFDEGYWPENDSTGAVLGTYAFKDTVYFTRRGGLWKYNYITKESVIIPASENGFDQHGYAQIIVNGLNDIFTNDGGFSLLHYNGNTWFSDVSINDLYGWLGLDSGNFDYKNNMIIIVGCFDCSYGNAIVVKGLR